MPTPATQPVSCKAAAAQQASAVAAPPVWSAVRPWDQNPTRASDQTLAGSRNTAVSADAIVHDTASGDAAEQPAGQHSKGKNMQQTTTSEQQADDAESPDTDAIGRDRGSPPAGPITGCLSLSCGENVTHQCTCSRSGAQALLYTLDASTPSG